MVGYPLLVALWIGLEILDKRAVGRRPLLGAADGGLGGSIVVDKLQVDLGVLKLSKKKIVFLLADSHWGKSSWSTYMLIEERADGRLVGPLLHDGL